MGFIRAAESSCCLASDAGGIPEVIDHGVNGFLLPRSKLQYLEEAILEFLELDRQKKANITLAARDLRNQAIRDRIVKDFSLAAEQVRLQELLAKLEA